MDWSLDSPSRGRIRRRPKITNSGGKVSLDDQTVGKQRLGWDALRENVVLINYQVEIQSSKMKLKGFDVLML